MNDICCTQHAQQYLMTHMAQHMKVYSPMCIWNQYVALRLSEDMTLPKVCFRFVVSRAAVFPYPQTVMLIVADLSNSKMIGDMLERGRASTVDILPSLRNARQIQKSVSAHRARLGRYSLSMPSSTSCVSLLCKVDRATVRYSHRDVQ